MSAFLFWGLSLVAGYGLTLAIKTANLPWLPATPSSPLFMFVSLLAVTALYQSRVNLTRGGPGPVSFVFGPPTPSILIDAGAYFAGALLAKGALS